MRPCRIQLSGVTLLLLMCWGAFITPLHSVAQSCSGTLGSITYDTVYTSTSTTLGGGGTNTYSYKLPEYPLTATYLLFGVAIKSNISVTTSVEVKNAGASPLAPNVKIYRTDDVLSSASGDVNNVYAPPPSFSFPSYNLPNLAPGATETLGPVTPINNYPLIYDSVSTADGADLNDYIGHAGDSVDIIYTSSTTPLVISPVTIVSTTVTETMHFSITYYYCIPGPLATDILTFMATRTNDQTIALNWINQNEQAGREYYAEVSHDGNSFTSFASQPSDPLNQDASYLQDYAISPTDKGKLYFRVKLVDANGLAIYSPLRIIDLGTSSVSGFSIYPNPPSDFLNLLFPSTTKGWQVDILSADGSLVQRNYYNNTNSGRLNFQRVLSSGTYFARATDLQTARSYVASFVIH